MPSFFREQVQRSAKENTIRDLDWEAVKKNGSEHYKTGTIEPIDLYRSLGILRQFCIGSIIKYASRNTGATPIKCKDMNKIIHYAEMLKAAYGDQYENKNG